MSEELWSSVKRRHNQIFRFSKDIFTDLEIQKVFYKKEWEERWITEEECKGIMKKIITKSD